MKIDKQKQFSIHFTTLWQALVKSQVLSPNPPIHSYYSLMGESSKWLDLIDSRSILENYWLKYGMI